MSTELLCKLTDQKMQTYGGYQWTLGEWSEADGVFELCGSGWLHAYTHPLLAVLLNPIHADVSSPRLFVIETDGERKDDRGLKVGFTRMRLVREMPLPTMTPVQIAAFGVLCALEVYGGPNFAHWARGWLSGEDRSPGSARLASGSVRPVSPIYSIYSLSAAKRAADHTAGQGDSASVAHWAVRSAAYSVDLIALAKRSLTAAKEIT